MKSLFNSFGFDISDEKLNLFNKYYEILVEYNGKVNLTAITEKKDVFVKHFIDSLFGLKYLSGKVLDVGSGGGFPSVPLKILNGDLDYTLLEATGKKCDFLNYLIKELNLKNIKVLNGRAEDFGKDILYREQFDFVTARAVASLPSLLEYCMPFVKVNGKFVAYKGDSEEEIKSSSNALKILNGKIINVDNFLLDGAKRSIIVVEKTGILDKKYPRGNGKERKYPL